MTSKVASASQQHRRLVTSDACRSCDARFDPKTDTRFRKYRAVQGDAIALPFCSQICWLRYLTSLEKTAFNNLHPDGSMKYPEYLDELRDWNNGVASPMQANPRGSQAVFLSTSSLGGLGWRCPDLL